MLDKIDALQQHFYNYLFTKTVRNISLHAKMKEKYWDTIIRLEGQKSLLYGRKNFKIEEIYDVIIPFVEFLKSVNTDVLPKFSSITNITSLELNLSPQEKSVRNILVDNYEYNIYSFGKILLELYELAVIEDLKENKNKTPLCLGLKEIKNIEEDLKFIEDYQNNQK